MYQQARLFENVVGAIHRHYIDSMGEGDLYQRAAAALVTSLNDPYAELLVRENYREYKRQMTGTKVDMGVQRRAHRIRAPAWARRPASEPGDEILSIDGKSTEGWSRSKSRMPSAAAPSPTVTVVVRPLGSDRPWSGGSPGPPSTSRGFAGRPARRRRRLRRAPPDERARRG